MQKIKFEQESGALNQLIYAVPSNDQIVRVTTYFELLIGIGGVNPTLTYVDDVGVKSLPLGLDSVVHDLTLKVRANTNITLSTTLGQVQQYNIYVTIDPIWDLT